MKKKNLLSLVTVLVLSVLLSMVSFISASSSAALENVKSDKVRSILADAIIFSEGAPTGIVRGEQLLLTDNSARKVAKKVDDVLYVPSAFLDECEVTGMLKTTMIDDTEYVSVDDIAKSLGASKSEAFGLAIISKNTSTLTKARNNAKVLKTFFGVYVSPDAKDGDGTYEKPVSTVEEAQSLVHKNMKENGWLSNEYTVYFRGGIYNLNRSVLFDAASSAPDGSKIIYDAYPDEEPVFKGGISIKGSEFTKVIQSEVYESLPAEAKDNVYMVDLSKYGYKPLGLTTNPNKQRVFYNNEEFTLARFPNYTNASTKGVIKAEATPDDPSSIFTVQDEDRVPNWANAPEPWIKADFVYTWYTTYHQVKIDPVEKTIDTVTSTAQSIGKNKPYFIYNLIEELDVQGEYYIDRTNNILYIYPYKADVINGTWNDKHVDIAVLTTPVVRFDGAKNVEIRRLDLQLSTGAGVQFRNESTKCGVYGCNIHNVAGVGVDMYGEENTVESCDIHHTGSYGVRFGGGELRVIRKSENRLINNRIYQTGASGIVECYDDSIGGYVENNEISRTNNQAIYGVNAKSKNYYNEIYDTSMAKIADSGIVYTYFRSFGVDREVKYNYFHDSWSCMSTIYQDGGSTGMMATGNIFHRTVRPVFDHGIGNNHYINNIYTDQMDSKYGNQAMEVHCWALSAPCYWDPQTLTLISGHETIQTTFLDKYKNFDMDIWKEQAPDSYALLMSGKVDGPVNKLIKNNVLMRTGAISVVKDTSKQIKVQGNITFKNDDQVGFVDYDNKNFNLREDSAIYKKIPDFVKVDYFDKIGVYLDDYRTKFPSIDEQDFGLLMPCDGEKEIYPEEVVFKWEECETTRQFRFQLATDPEFKNIIRDDYVDGNIHTVVGLRYGKKEYYWRVFNVNTRNAKLYPLDAEKMCNVPYYSFSTMAEEIVDLSGATKVLERVDAIGANIQEGTGAGQHFAGTKNFFDKTVSDFKAFLASGNYSQRELDKKVELFEADINGIDGRRHQEVLVLNDALAVPTEWDIEMNTVAEYEKGLKFMRLSKTSQESFGYKTPIETYQIVKFDLIMDMKGKSWIYFGLRSDKTNGTYVDNQLYFIGLNPGYGLELQRWNTGGKLNLNWWGENAWKPVNGQRYTIEIGAVTLEDGNVRIFMKIDGKTMIDYIDDSEFRIQRNGYFTVYCSGGGDGSTVYLLPTAEE